MAELDRSRLEEWLAEVFGHGTRLSEAVLIPGGASKETWSVRAEGRRGSLDLIVRRESESSMSAADVLGLGREYQLLETVHRHGVRVPAPHAYTDDLSGRPAFVMDRVEGVGIGRQVVKSEELGAARERLPEQLAEALARIHGIPGDELPELAGPAPGEAPARQAIRRLEGELDRFDEPHPAIELGLAWLRAHAPTDSEVTLVHGDFRVGNILVDQQGLAAVLDWELAHLGAPAEDLGWPLVRAWRFGRDDLRLGGVGSAERFLERYNALSGRELTPADLDYWEMLGNVNWAVIQMVQARRHLSGSEPSVELAVIGRLTSETEREILHLLDRLG